MQSEKHYMLEGLENSTKNMFLPPPPKMGYHITLFISTGRAP